MLVARAAALPITAVYGVAKIAVGVAERATATPEPPAAPPQYHAGPPLVAVDGWLHQDVVRDVYTGWTGTVLHSRKIGTGSLARVRWSNTFASTPLEEVSSRLVLVSRKPR